MTSRSSQPTPTDENVKPRCCWCGGPFAYERARLVLPSKRVAWCKNSKKCRARQRACAINRVIKGKREWLFVPTPKGCEVLEATEPNLFMCGNRGGGKSHNIRWMCHALAMAIPGFKYAILRTSFPELSKNHLDFLIHERDCLGGEKRGYFYNKTDHVFRYPNGSIGYFAQCATDADVKKVLGAEVFLVVFDEAPTFQWDHMRLIAASIRVPEGSGLVPMTRYLGNPIGESIDELWSYFVDQDVDILKDSEYRPQNWRYISMNIQDNPYLNAKQYWQQFSGLPAHVIKAWKEGVRAESDTLFAFYPTLNGKPYHVIDEIPKLGDGTPLFVRRNNTFYFPPWVQVYRAYDHGFNPDPAVCLWFAVFGKRKLCFWEDDWNGIHAERIAPIIVKKSAGMRVVDTFCDPTLDVEDGKDINTVKQKFENKGVPMTCSINDRAAFADAIHSGLGEEASPGVPSMQFLAPGRHGLGCPNTIKYIPRMKWDENNFKKMKAHKKDHWVVCLAYFLLSLIPETKPRDVKVMKPWMVDTSKPKTALAKLMLRRMRRQTAVERSFHTLDG